MTPTKPHLPSTHELTNDQLARADALQLAVDVLNERLGLDADYVGPSEMIRLAHFIVTGQEYHFIDPPPERYLRGRLTALADCVLIVADKMVESAENVIERVRQRTGVQS